MPNLRKSLPTPMSLVFFEAAARKQSFSTAAKEMAVTQAAVSRQVRQLELQIGVELFRRLHRRVELTPEGAALSDAVSLGLSHISEAIARIQRRRQKAGLTVAANVAVMALWLRPRIMTFLHGNPEVDIRLIATDEPLDYVNDDIDLAVDYGAAGSMPAGSVHLFPEAICAVASPLLAKSLGIRAPKDLARATLLHEELLWPGWVSWNDWLRAAGCDIGFHRVVRFNNYPMLLEAAAEGEGVALGWETLIDEFLMNGRLIKVLPNKLVTGRGYYLVKTAAAGHENADKLFSELVADP